MGDFEFLSWFQYIEDWRDRYNTLAGVEEAISIFLVMLFIAISLVDRCKIQKEYTIRKYLVLRMLYITDAFLTGMIICVLICDYKLVKFWDINIEDMLKQGYDYLKSSSEANTVNMTKSGFKIIWAELIISCMFFYKFGLMCDKWERLLNIGFYDEGRRKVRANSLIVGSGIRE